jgi:hypothetical protein
MTPIVRQPARYSRQEKLDYVNEVIKLVDLDDCADAVVESCCVTYPVLRWNEESLNCPLTSIRPEMTPIVTPARYSRQEKLDYVNEVIKLVDLDDCADAVVGHTGEGPSRTVDVCRFKSCCVTYPVLRWNEESLNCPLTSITRLRE